MLVIVFLQANIKFMSMEVILDEIRRYEKYLQHKDPYIRATANDKLEELYQEYDNWITFLMEAQIDALYNDSEDSSQSITEREEER